MSSRSLSRRTLLRASLAAGVAAIAAACGGPAPSVTGTASPSPANRSPDDGGPVETPSSTATPEPTPAPTASPVALETLIASLLVVGFRGETLRAGGWMERALAGGLGGVILFDRDQETGGSRNVRSPAQVRRLTAAIRDAAGGAPIIAIDQEGGLVTRLSPAHGYPAVASEADIGSGSTARARRWARDLAATLADAGVTLNLAPVVDMNVNPSSPAIGALGRSFSADADVVVRMAGIEVAAHRAAGVATALKHFPGIGSSTGNTDDGSVDVTRTWHRAELAPFRRLIEEDRADVVMVGHVRNDRLDPHRPASQSRAVVTDLLRGTLGWEGVIVTDDLQAGAVAADGPAEAAIRALKAGADLLLFANQLGYDNRIVDTVVAALADAVRSGRLDRATVEASAARIGSLFPRR
ncbi:MAG TPA: glycoside hydrolase family 3 N-terminal domain-containing protein [Candidatus Limnocylindrales bacterium]|nr:glycoside hydrolase family 3 N-terminal domain-containing protein [Candidatus Limnocylindrales bacterium]